MNELIIILLPLLAQVESGSNPDAIGDNGKAVGIYQLHKCVVDDVNEIYSMEFKYSDRFKPQLAKVIAQLYLRYWGIQYEKKTGKKVTLEVLARCFNGGPKGYKKESTVKYWNKIKKVMK